MTNDTSGHEAIVALIHEIKRERRLRRIYRDRAPQFDKHRTHAVERNAISGEDAFMVCVIMTLLTVAFVLLFGA